DNTFAPRVSESGSRAGVELERRPVEGLSKNARGVQQRELGGTQGDIRILTVLELTIKMVHQFRRYRVVSFPQSANHVMRASPQKCPRKPHQAFSRVSARTRPEAG